MDDLPVEALPMPVELWHFLHEGTVMLWAIEPEGMWQSPHVTLFVGPPWRKVESPPMFLGAGALALWQMPSVLPQLLFHVFTLVMLCPCPWQYLQSRPAWAKVLLDQPVMTVELWQALSEKHSRFMGVKEVAFALSPSRFTDVDDESG
jgi:hypothetical protein